MFFKTNKNHPLAKVGIVIRNKRLRKFRNKHWAYILCVKLAMIVLTTTFSLISLIGTTNALFNDIETTGFSITAQWDIPPDDDVVWDRSSLEFIDPVIGDYKGITAIIKNVGNEDMAGTVIYEVYRTPIGSGSPKNGTKVSSGTVPMLAVNEEHSLEYTPTESGKYMFRAFQRPLHGDPNGTGGGNGNPEKDLWSSEITVTFPSINNVEQPDSDAELPADTPQQEEGTQVPDETETNDEAAPPNEESEQQETPDETEESSNESSDSTQQERTEEESEDEPNSGTDTQ
jgi:YqxM protein